jgi:signal transduction histidine kinase
MAKSLRVLIVEDSEADAALILHELRRNDYDVTHERVDTPEAMSAALEGQPWDIVLSDYTMPHFSGPAALSLVKEQASDLPFIIISGTIGEEAAVTSLRAGAHDFLVKGALARLVPAIERERREAGVRAERKKMREQLLISERMASVGILAAGVAHEINNPLAVLTANLELVSEQLTHPTQQGVAGDFDRPGRSRTLGEQSDGPGDLKQLIKDAQEAAERVRLIVRDLSLLSRSNDEEKRVPVEIHRVLETSIRMASNETRHRAYVIRDYGDLPRVMGSEAKLGQVFINLIVNAAHAVPEGKAGTNEIRIVTRKDTAGCAVIEVHDTGSGIPPNVLPRIFDAFFTTKAVTTGTGLGLAICHRIIAAYGGTISVESQIGRGSVFRIVLPPADDKIPEIQSGTTEVAPGRRARILVVDDEKMLGVTIQRALEGEHEVTAVTTAKEALCLLSGDKQFDLVLCDLMMPEMTGMELYAELLQLAPDKARKFAFMTGGAFTEDASRFLARVSNASIDKPIRLSKLRDFVRLLVNNRVLAFPVLP